MELTLQKCKFHSQNKNIRWNEEQFTIVLNTVNIRTKPEIVQELDYHFLFAIGKQAQMCCMVFGNQQTE